MQCYGLCYHNLYCLTEWSYHKSARLSAHGPQIAVNATTWPFDYRPTWLLYLPHMAGVPCGLPTTAVAAVIVCKAACLSHIAGVPCGLPLLLLPTFPTWLLCLLHIAVAHMWGPYPLPLLLWLSFLHGCLPTLHSWCTLWAPIAACSYHHLHGCITYPT